MINFNSSSNAGHWRILSRSAILGAAAVICLSTAAAAQSATTAPARANASGTTTPTAVTTGSISGEPSFDQLIKECMGMWDKGTHMSKQQWRRSCKTTLRSLSSP